HRSVWVSAEFRVAPFQREPWPSTLRVRPGRCSVLWRSNARLCSGNPDRQAAVWHLEPDDSERRPRKGGRYRRPIVEGELAAAGGRLARRRIPEPSGGGDVAGRPDGPRLSSASLETALDRLSLPDTVWPEHPGQRRIHQHALEIGSFSDRDDARIGGDCPV